MFSEQTQLHYQSATAKTETHNDVTTAVVAASFVLDALTPPLARDLSDDIEDLCFTKHGRIRDEISQVKIRLRERQQCVTIRMAVDVAPHVVLRHVRIPSLRITKRGEDPREEVERKSKKVTAAAESLRATLDCLVLPENDEVRKFLLMMAGKTFHVAFEDEAKQLDFGPDDDEAEDDDDAAQPDLAFGRAPRKAKPVTEKDVVASLDENSVELKPEAIKRMTPAQRGQVLAWAAAMRLYRDGMESAGASLADMPPAPSFVLDPRELLPAPVPDPAAGDVLEEQPKAKAAKAPKRENHWKAKRQAKAFTNPPRIAKPKKGRR